MSQARDTKPSTHPASASGTTERTMEDLISLVLRVGVLIAGAVILLGLVLSFIPAFDQGSSTNIHDLLDDGGSRVSVSAGSIWDGLRVLDPIAIIQLGLLLLILTPIVRVGMTFFLFVKEPDRFFMVVTAIVFVVLLLGFTGIL